MDKVTLMLERGMPKFEDEPVLLAMSFLSRRVYKKDIVKRTAEALAMLEYYGLEPGTAHEPWAPPMADARKTFTEEQGDTDLVHLALSLYKRGRPDVPMRACAPGDPDEVPGWVAERANIRRMHALTYNPEQQAFVVPYENAPDGKAYYWGSSAVNKPMRAAHGAAVSTLRWRKRVWRRACRMSKQDPIEGSVSLGEPVFYPEAWSQLKPDFVHKAARSLGLAPEVTARAVLDARAPVPQHAFSAKLGEKYADFVPAEGVTPLVTTDLSQIEQRIRLYAVSEAVKERDAIVFNGEPLPM